MKIVHISDLHIWGLNFVPEWSNKIIDIVDSIRPELVIVTGDLIDDGYMDEYERAKEYLDRLKAKNMLVVPGNHDARNEGYTIFEEIFRTRFPHYENEKVAVLGIDSSEPDIDDGHIGRANYAYIEEKLLTKDKITILAMHHHLIPIPGTGRERNIPVDAGDVLKLCVGLKINFVLSGHKHHPWIWKLEDTYLITVGTACSRRLKGRSYPSFNIMTIDNEEVSLEEINVSNGGSKKTLRVGIKPG